MTSISNFLIETRVCLHSRRATDDGRGGGGRGGCQANIRAGVGTKLTSLGTFEHAEDAARAYDEVSV
jgi:hypothetical protein